MKGNPRNDPLNTPRDVPWYELPTHPNYAGALSLESTSSPAQVTQRGNEHFPPEDPAVMF